MSGVFVCSSSERQKKTPRRASQNSPYQRSKGASKGEGLGNQFLANIREVDAIVQLRDGRWIAIEVKLGGERAIEQAARNLRVFAEKVDDIHRDQLCGLVILTAGEASYPRDDGTMVVSLGHLCA